MSNLQTNFNLKNDFKNWTNIQGASGWSTAPNTTSTVSCKAWNFPVNYPSWEYKSDINDPDGNMFNPIF